MFVLYDELSSPSLLLTLHTLAVALRVRHQHQQRLGHNGVVLAGVLLRLHGEVADLAGGGGGAGVLTAHLDTRHVIISVPVDDYLGPHRRWNYSCLIFGIFYLR